MTQMEFILVKEGRGLSSRIIPLSQCLITVPAKPGNTEVQVHFADGTFARYEVSHAAGGKLTHYENFPRALAAAISESRAK